MEPTRPKALVHPTATGTSSDYRPTTSHIPFTNFHCPDDWSALTPSYHEVNFRFLGVQTIEVLSLCE
jgi:hypothetical protein